MSETNKRLSHIFLLIFLSLFPLFMSSESIIENSPFLYFSLVMVGLSVCYRKDSLSHLVTPNALIYFYFTLTFFLGSWGYSNEYVLVDKDLKVFTDWRYRQVSTCLSMLCTSLFLVVDIVYHKRYEVISSKINWSKHNGYFLFGTLFLVPFFFVSLNLDFIGAQGDLAILPKGIAAISVILYLSKLNKIKRYLGYGVLIVSVKRYLELISDVR